MSSSDSDNPYQSPQDPEPNPPGRAITAEGDFTQHDLKQVHRALLGKYRGLFFWFFAAIMTLIVVLLLEGGLGKLRTIAGVLFFCSPLLILLLLAKSSYYWASSWRHHRAALVIKPTRQRMQLSDEGIRVTANEVELTFEWNRCARLLVERELLVILLKPSGWIALPAHFFNSRDDFLAAQRFIQERLR